MNQDYIKPDNWSIIEEDRESVNHRKACSVLAMGLWDNVPTLKKL
jgi:hypothetical protein